MEMNRRLGFGREMLMQKHIAMLTPFALFIVMLAESLPYTAPANYHGSTFNDAPVGFGNDTIFGGTGNDAYFLSNGDNWLDAGGGSGNTTAENDQLIRKAA